VTTNFSFSKATASPLLATLAPDASAGEHSRRELGEGLGVRSNLTKRQIEVTMFACGIEKVEELALSLVEV